MFTSVAIFMNQEDNRNIFCDCLGSVEPWKEMGPVGFEMVCSNVTLFEGVLNTQYNL